MATWRVRYAGTCADCGLGLPAGMSASWDKATQTLRCLGCAEIAPATVTPEPGVAGHSARAEHERRVARQETAIEARWGTGIAGRVVKALSTEPQTTRAWAIGAAGEERLARVLASVEGIGVLHDRGIPASRANIDHIVVAPSGIFVIDAKNHRGTVRVDGRGPMWARERCLTIDGRDQSSIADGMLRQVEAVTWALGEHPVPRICAALCFVAADWPLLDRPSTFRDVHLTSPRTLVKLLRVPGSLSAIAIGELTETLALRLPVR